MSNFCISSFLALTYPGIISLTKVKCIKYYDVLRTCSRVHHEEIACPSCFLLYQFQELALQISTVQQCMKNAKLPSLSFTRRSTKCSCICSNDMTKVQCYKVIKVTSTGHQPIIQVNKSSDCLSSHGTLGGIFTMATSTGEESNYPSFWISL